MTTEDNTAHSVEFAQTHRHVTLWCMAYYLVLSTGTAQHITAGELQYHQSVSCVLTDNTTARMMVSLTFLNTMKRTELFLLMRQASII